MGRHIKCKKSCAESMPSHQTVKNRLITGSMGAVSSMLFVLSGIIIGGELFDSYRMTASYITILMLAIILFSVLNSRVADLVLGIGAAIVIVYTIVFQDSVFVSLCARGSSQIINEYIEKWNYYFETAYSFPDYGYEGVTFFCSVATAMLIIIIHIASGILRKKTVYVLYPLLFSVGNLLVGYAPEAPGMMCMFAGALLALNVDTAGRRKNRNGCKGYFVTAGMSVCIVICSYMFFDGPANIIVGAHDDVREFQKNIELGIKYWTMYGTASDDGLVTNASPEYTGKEAIKVTVKSELYDEDYSGRYDAFGMPYSGMYLKGYQSSDYYNGRWVYNHEKYNNFCENLGVDEQEMSEQVFKTEDYSIVHKKVNEDVELEYTGVYDHKAYMPYRSYYHANNEGIHMTEDYRFARENNVTKVNVMRDIKSDLYCYGINYLERLQYSTSYITDMPDVGDMEHYKEYSEYVRRNYLEVPDEQKTARIIADEIKQERNMYITTDLSRNPYDPAYVEEIFYIGRDSDAGDSIEWMIDENGMGIAEYDNGNYRVSLEKDDDGNYSYSVTYVEDDDGNNGVSSVKEDDGNQDTGITIYDDLYLTDNENMYTSRALADVYAINRYRDMMAEQVAWYLQEHASYTLHPRDNGSEDAIEYFLSKNREGFCVHFASAGVMILRSMGIPARYVTGYVAFPRDFKRTEDKRGFSASIKDYAAHAWVEVYMERYGWVPYEMTPAYDYSEDKLPTQWTEAETRERRRKDDTEKNDDKNTADKREQENAVPSPTADNSVKAREFQGASIGIVLTIFIISLTVVAVIVILIIRKRRYIYTEAVLESKINSGKYNKAVKMINRNIYLTLKDKDKNKTRHIRNDTDFYNELQNIYMNHDMAEWEKYAGIVRKAVYSDTAVTKEEVRYCMEMMNSIKDI